jgi:hypothetical protein
VRAGRRGWRGRHRRRRRTVRSLHSTDPNGLWWTELTVDSTPLPVPPLTAHQAAALAVDPALLP